MSGDYAGQAVLAGGPHDGHPVTDDGGYGVINATFSYPLPIWDYRARPRWRRHPIAWARFAGPPSPWRHPIAWARWQPPLPPPPRDLLLTYRRTGEVTAGRRVYRLADDGVWPGPWRSPAVPADTADHDLIRALLLVEGATHPLIRQTPGTHWIMDHIWRMRLAHLPDLIPGPANTAEMILGTAIDPFGIPVEIRPGAGPPFLENTRIPADWPGS